MDFWGINSDWSEWIMEEMTPLSCRAKTFARILISLRMSPGLMGLYPVLREVQC